MKKLPIVLLHGGLHGGWCWKKVRSLLAAAGHEVFTPTLTGLGDRSHLGGADISLATHVQDLLATIEAEELERFVLVGHSYGGMIITAAAEALGGRIAQLVYLDALVPRDGECAADITGLTMRYADMPDGMIHGFADYNFGLTDQADIAWVQRRITPQSVRTVLEPVRLATDHRHISRWFVECTAGRDGAVLMDGIARRAAEIADDPSWRHLTLDAGHDCMISHPADTAKLLIAIAECSERG